MFLYLFCSVSTAVQQTSVPAACGCFTGVLLVVGLDYD